MYFVVEFIDKTLTAQKMERILSQFNIIAQNIMGNTVLITASDENKAQIEALADQAIINKNPLCQHFN